VLNLASAYAYAYALVLAFSYALVTASAYVAASAHASASAYAYVITRHTGVRPMRSILCTFHACASIIASLVVLGLAVLFAVGTFGELIILASMEGR